MVADSSKWPLCAQPTAAHDVLPEEATMQSVSKPFSVPACSLGSHLVKLVKGFVDTVCFDIRAALQFLDIASSRNRRLDRGAVLINDRVS